MSKKIMPYKMLADSDVKAFRAKIYEYFAQHKRNFPWRYEENAYYVIVSEIMLQQTQTERVRKKYEEFIASFPTINSLASASTAAVLRAWQGLGYNRRALALQAFAQRVVNDYGGIIPQDPAVLQTCKGIGYASASSICAFVFNKPTIFIETNIRSVFIHLFFDGQVEVHDKAIMPLVEQTLDKENPRQWYYALMDYGVMLKKTIGNPNRKSSHYNKQSAFQGSRRQLRGQIITFLATHRCVSLDEIAFFTKREVNLVQTTLAALEAEGFIKQEELFYSLAY